MSNLQEMGIDENVQENDGGTFIVVPAGKYKMVIVGDQVKDTNAKTGKILLLKNQIVEGSFSGTIIDNILNIKNPSQVAERIGQGTLKRICRITGVPFPPPDTTFMYGKPFIGTVGTKEFKSNTTGAMIKSNKIQAYNPIDSSLVAEPEKAKTDTEINAEINAEINTEKKAEINAEKKAEDFLDEEW